MNDWFVKNLASQVGAYIIDMLKANRITLIGFLLGATTLLLMPSREAPQAQSVASASTTSRSTANTAKKIKTLQEIEQDEKTMAALHQQLEELENALVKLEVGLALAR